MRDRIVRYKEYAIDPTWLASEFLYVRDTGQVKRLDLCRKRAAL
jgi:hypothetical protein